MIKKFVLFTLIINGSCYLQAWRERGIIENVLYYWQKLKIKTINNNVSLLSSDHSRKKVPSERFDISGEKDCRGFGRRRMSKEEINKLQEEVEDGRLSVNAHDICDDSPSLLEYAIMLCDVNFCKFLIKKGADVHRINYSHEPLLHMLVYESNKHTEEKIEIIELLLESGVDINVYGVKGYGANTVLHKAVKDDDVSKKMIEFLIKKGVDVNARDEAFGATALVNLFRWYNVRKEDVFGVTQVLLNAGSDVNAQDEYGYTPLLELLSYGIYAKEDGKENKVFKIIDLLLEAGADIKIKNNDGKNAFDYEIFNDYIAHRPYGKYANI